MAEYAATAAAEGEESLEELVLGDDFVTQEHRQRQSAQEKRRQRQKRLEQLQQQQQKHDEQDDRMVVDHKAKRVKVQHEEKPTTAQVMESSIQKGDDDDSEEFDMFAASSSVSPIEAKDTANRNNAATKKQEGGHEQQDWDDAEGYYKPVIGETIQLQPNNTSSSSSSSSSSDITFRVSGVIGKGVFATVLKCSTISNNTSIQLPMIVALKMIRHNETMAKAAQTELEILQRLKGSPGIVQLLMPHNNNSNNNNKSQQQQTSRLEHRGHVVFVFDFMEYNLRDVLQKFGKGVGLSLQAVRSYFGQLLAAATHLQKNGIIHADLKPDNILVSADFSHVQVADFGSAMDTSLQQQPTPYLVSRFYRAPEIILGLTPTFAIDLWSLAVTVAELFLGTVLFKGTSNNDMLYVFMQHVGAVPNRVIRQHLVVTQKYNVVPSHFRQEGAQFYFLQQTVDSVSGAPVHKILSLLSNNNDKNDFPKYTLHHRLLQAKSAKDSRKMVHLFADLLKQCLMLDPSRRIALKDALGHEFFQQQRQQGGATAITTTAAEATTASVS